MFKCNLCSIPLIFIGRLHDTVISSLKAHFSIFLYLDFGVILSEFYLRLRGDFISSLNALPASMQCACPIMLKDGKNDRDLIPYKKLEVNFQCHTKIVVEVWKCQRFIESVLEFIQYQHRLTSLKLILLTGNIFNTCYQCWIKSN